ncbi:MAG: hypothetical protein WCS86_03045 [Candidatus Paceibacterota bacterium]
MLEGEEYTKKLATGNEELSQYLDERINIIKKIINELRIQSIKTEQEEQSTTDQQKIAKQNPVDELENEEKKKEIIKKAFEQLRLNAEIRRRIRKELSSLIKERDLLLKQGETTKYPQEDEEKAEPVAGEKNEKMKNTETVETAYEMQDRLNLLKEEKINKDFEYKGTFFILDWSKRKTLKKELKELETKIDKLNTDLIEKIKQEIESDKKEKQFQYYMASKVTNKHIPTLVNQQTNLIDLRWSDKDYLDNSYGKMDRLVWTTEDEGYYHFTISGFVMIIKNVKEIQDDEGINFQSEKAIYRIEGPDGEIIKDNIQGYDEANSIYVEEVKRYENKMAEDFNNLNNK